MSYADTHRRLHQFFNERRFSELEARLAPDVVIKDQGHRVRMDTAIDFISWLRAWSATFEDGAVIDAEYLEGDGFSIARFIGYGTMTGLLDTFEPTGRTLNLPFCEILFHRPDGMISAGEFYYDQRTLFDQLELATTTPRPRSARTVGSRV